MKNNDEIAAAIVKKVNMLILQLIPTPTCSTERAKHPWRVEQVKKKVATELWPENNGINIEIKV